METLCQVLVKGAGFCSPGAEWGRGEEVTVVHSVMFSLCRCAYSFNKGGGEITEWDRDADRQPAEASEGGNYCLCVLGMLSPCLHISRQNIGIHF